MDTTSHPRISALKRPFLLSILLLAILGLAVWARVRGVAAFSALYDAVGPYWAAIRFDGRPHADPYGPLLVVPYLPGAHLTASLWEAVQVTASIHSLIAVLAFVASLRMWPKRVGFALCLGVLVALDAGLVDTVVSGAKGYFSALFIALMLVVRGGWIWVAWAFAVSSHPLALVALPLALQPGSFSRSNIWGLVFFTLTTGTQVWGWSAPGVGVGSSISPIILAIKSYVGQGGWFAIVVLMGPVVGMCSDRTRDLALRCSLGFLLMAVLGWQLGYLRDHHIRIMTVPSLLCWGAVPGRWVLGIMATMRIPAHPVFPEGLVAREGTVGLTHRVTDLLEQETPPYTVDGAWVSSSPAVEPAGAMLDLYLRGWRASELRPSEEIVVVLSAEREDLGKIPQVGQLISAGDRYRVFRASNTVVNSWSVGLCNDAAKLGGAWDALSILHPTTTVGDLGQWWACE